jgi:ABC-2 type transport system permease protein
MTRAARAFAAAVRLGWEVSSNWTQPLIFVIYSIVRPISGALILVVMYTVISGGGAGVSQYLAFLVVGVAFWSFVQNGLAGFANGIMEDRGFYRTLKYIYIAPQRFFIYLTGRGVAQLGSAAVSVVIVLVAATLALRLPIHVLHVDYPLLLIACSLAFVTVVAVAMAYSLALLAAQQAYGYGEIFAQTLFIVSGAIFPISVLPGPLSTLAALSPFVYWLELVRRALLHDQAVRMFPALSDAAVLGRLILATAAALVLAFLVVGWADRRARRLGLIDLETNW